MGGWTREIVLGSKEVCRNQLTKFHVENREAMFLAAYTQLLVFKL